MPKCFVRSRIGYSFVWLLLQSFCKHAFGLGGPTRNNLSSVTRTVSILGNCYTIPDYIDMKSSTEIVPALCRIRFLLPN